MLQRGHREEQLGTFEGHVFHSVLVRGGIGEKNGCGTLYLKGVTDVFKKQVEYFERDEMMSRLECESALPRAAFPSKTTQYI